MEHPSKHLYNPDSNSAESTNTTVNELSSDVNFVSDKEESTSSGDSGIDNVIDPHVEEHDTSPVTLHSICGMANILLALPDNVDLRQFGQETIAVTHNLVSIIVPNPNVTIFGIRCVSIGDVTTWWFHGRPAQITVTNQLVNSWDFCATFKATLTRGEHSIEMGGEVFQENVVGLMHEGARVHPAHSELNTFTAEELVEGAREQFSKDDTFELIPIPDIHHPLSRPVQALLSAFSHWSYERSGRTSIIGGFQGVGPLITEAVVHNVNVPWTIGNFGSSAIKRFPHEHFCGKFCRVLGDLPALPRHE
ncbi:uncharacterized protein MELLADRAFT_92191 [Melampsora larici-populina 98AG31]|uniref:Alpha-type protein kinase domain-containing protein n=1 Tax=Melampsora larici-populina (strain 98AG31 / pathotype 3-4-7) TaxID=747676 RepID=F4S1U7_MELLP|nr:uncharacterized protein MELLADRAFT_92191 [Melampsora larici-populina 98AG31]EGG01446.1 hypothetical protein MELLADRAFT_92191 [Melampsora larici-populina 98AG31]